MNLNRMNNGDSDNTAKLYFIKYNLFLKNDLQVLKISNKFRSSNSWMLYFYLFGTSIWFVREC